MHVRRFPLALTATAMLGAFLAHSASAQLPTTVQLPSFSSFSYSGTVVVPDSGAAYLGGVSRSASGLNRRGLSRGFGSSQLRSGASVRATIIDHNEIDRQLLGATPKEIAKQQDTGRQLGPVRRVSPTEEGKALVRYARQLYRDGKRAQSFDTYRMAIEILPSGLKELASDEFQRGFGTAAKQALRTASARR